MTLRTTTLFSRKALQWPRGCWPNAAQQRLLEACFLADDAQSRRAWSEWRRLVPLDFIDGSSLRLLLIAYQRLRDDAMPDMARLSGIVRFHWVHTQVLQRETAKLLRVLNDAGVETILLKGAALNATVYSSGTRAMSDIDIVVRRDQVDRALGLLERQAWQPRFRCHEKMPWVSHAAHLTSASRHDVDLHWDLFHQRRLSDAQLDSVWAASRPIEVGGQPTRALCPADQLLHTCEHGVRYNATPPFRWLADACQILRVEGDQIDWRRCGAMAAEHDVFLPLKRTLQYLQQRLQVELPAAAASQLRGRRVSLRSRWSHRLVERRQPGLHPFLQELPGHVLAHSRMRKARPNLGLGEYLCLVNDLEMTPRQCLQHFSRLATAAFQSRCRDRVRAVWRRLRGRRPLRTLSMAAARPERIEGMHAVELHQGQVFRWTHPEAAIRLRVPPATYEAALRLLPVRELAANDLQIHFNGKRIACDASALSLVRFRLPREQFVDHHEQRLVLRCRPWDAAATDPRPLGLPLLGIELLAPSPSGRDSSIPRAKAA